MRDNQRNQANRSALWACLLASALLAGCSTSGDTTQDVKSGQETIDGTSYSFTGKGNFDALSAAERKSYTAARNYVRDLAGPDELIRINHADPRQHAFSVLRLKLAGKTPASSPQVFELLEELRREHVRLGYEVGKPAPKLSTKSAGNERERKHFLGSTNLITPTDPEELPHEFEAVAIASNPGGTCYTFTDVGVWDTTGEPIGNLNFIEQYDEGQATKIRTVGDTDLGAGQDAEGDTYSLTDDCGASGVSIAGVVETYRARPTRGREIQYVEPYDITAPVDTVGPNGGAPDGCVGICLNRTWTNDCDYDLTGTPAALKIPLAGCVDIAAQSANSYSFDANAVAAYANDPNPPGFIRVTLTDVGGGCDVDNNNSISLSMQTFWQNVTLSNNNDTLCWDMTGANAALFDSSCRQVQDTLELFMNLPLPWIKGGSGVTGNSPPVTIHNDPLGQVGQQIPPIKVTNSCLAAGTMIQMADGSTQAIESIEAGETTFSPYNQSNGALTVVDTAKGFEDVPMVRIEDEGGRTLLMTEMHPIATPAGMVIAKHLKEGDLVKTQTGISKLVRVAREKYDGDVFNLKVGNETEAQSLGEDQTVVYANGFVVGDGQIQSKYESLEMKGHREGDVRERLPKRWQKDYLSSALRAR